MPSLDVPIKVQLGCDDCYRFLLAERAKWEAERERLQAKLRTYETRPLAAERDRYRRALFVVRGLIDPHNPCHDGLREALLNALAQDDSLEGSGA